MKVRLYNKLVEEGENKVQIVKIVKDFTGIGLKDAKDLVDSAPKTIKKGGNIWTRVFLPITKKHLKQKNLKQNRSHYGRR